MLIHIANHQPQTLLQPHGYTQTLKPVWKRKRFKVFYSVWFQTIDYLSQKGTFVWYHPSSPILTQPNLDNLIWAHTFIPSTSVLASPKRQDIARCRFSQHSVIFVLCPVVFPAPCLFQSLGFIIVMKTAVKLPKMFMFYLYNLPSLRAFSTGCLKRCISEPK